MIDIDSPEHIQIVIDRDGKTVWINDEMKCVFRACRIKNLKIEDNRVHKKQ